jgi:hypothetical protein
LNKKAMPQLDILTFFSQALTIFCSVLFMFILIVSAVLPVIYKNKKTAIFMSTKGEIYNLSNINLLFKSVNLIYSSATVQLIDASRLFSDELKVIARDLEPEQFAVDAQELLAEESIDFFSVVWSKNNMVDSGI